MHPTIALFQRNAWATERLLNWCQWQPAAANPAAADVYGGVEATFNHILAAETRYLRLLTSETPADAVAEKAPRALAELLSGAKMSEHSDDDKTLVLAVL